jgi:hypothetical protein
MTMFRRVLAVVLGLVLFLPAWLAFLVLAVCVGLVVHVWGTPKVGQAPAPTPYAWLDRNGVGLRREPKH